MAGKSLSPKQQQRLRKKKRELRKNLKRRMRNKAVRTRVKNLTKEFKKILEELKAAIDSNRTESLEELKGKAEEKLRELYKAIDMAYSKGVFHRNEAARRKSRAASKLAKLLKTLEVTS